VSVFIGNSALPVLATQGGLVEHLVKLNDKVDAGQKVAIQRNSFGEVVAEYTSSVAGEIAGGVRDIAVISGRLLVSPIPSASCATIERCDFAYAQ